MKKSPLIYPVRSNGANPASNGVYAIIPARGGSKGIPKKNIADLGGFPLIAYSIAAAKLSKKISRIIVSTDNEEFAEIAKKFGAEVPFLRPKEISGDKSTDLEFVLHVLDWFKKNEGKIPDYLVHLRPTTPLRQTTDIDSAIEKITVDKKATALRSGHEIRESPYKLFAAEGKYFVGLFPNEKRPEYWNLPRQSFPPVYQPDGYVDILVSRFVLKNKVIHGKKIVGFISPDTGEIDRAEDFKFLEFKLEKERWAIYDWLKKKF